MELKKTHLTPPTFELCEEKASKVLRWVIESEDLSKESFSIAKIFEHGVLQHNTKTFLQLLLEERFPGRGNELELNPEELRQILFDAFTNTFLYLLSPQSFIPEFLSFGSISLHINVQMLARLNSCTDYPYFGEMLEEWFTVASNHNNAEDRKTNLKPFLHDLECAIMKYSTPTEVASYLKPLYEFIASDSLDRTFAEIYLEDKGIFLPLDNTQSSFAASELSSFLSESFKDWSSSQPKEIHSPIPEYNTFLKELREVGVVLPEPNSHVLTESKESKQNLPPLEMFISSKLREKCLEKIFHQNVNEYNRAISLLNSIEDFSQAELNLNTLLQIHKVKPGSKVAVRLSEALHLKFGIPILNQTS